MNQYDGIVGQSQDFPQRILNQTYGQSAPAPLAFSESSGPSKKSYKQMAEEVKSDTIADIQDEQENLSDRLDALEAKTEQKKRKTVKEFWNANHRKVKIAIAVGAALILRVQVVPQGQNQLQIWRREVKPQCHPTLCLWNREEKYHRLTSNEQ